MKTLPSTLEHLNRQSSLIHEIIVVDSSPTEIQQELTSLVKQYPIVKTVFLDKKTIPAIGRNIGASKAEGSLLLFIDSDAYPDADWVETVLKAYSDGARVGGGGIELPEFQTRNLLAMAQFFLQFNEFMPNGNKRQKPFVPSCNLFCDKELFNELGGFPEVRASEDVLFGLNASQSNELWFLPDSKVFHIFGDSFKRFRTNQFLLGKYVAAYKKDRLKNSVKRFLFSPAIQLPAFAVVPAYKYMLLLTRIIHADARHIVMFSAVSPVVFLGLLFWSAGFLNGATASGDPLRET
ncbi:MAG: glycosyltransferase [Deltaproteobacteria bacterium]|nr:glycosyltransferase [Deltaproteobacteria bacterium]